MSATDDSDFVTETESGLPWEDSSDAAGENTLHLTLVWSLEEPHREGETASIAGECVFGRGDLRSGDAAERILLAAQRPTQTPIPNAVQSGRISRTHLVFQPAGEARARVRNVGRGALFHNGVQVDETVVKPGDTLRIQNAAVFLVELRPTRIPWLRKQPPDLDFPFGSPDAHGIVGETPAIWQLREHAWFAAAADRHVLLLGESGVGKELAARAVHALSARGKRELISRNAATFPGTLVDAELFGNVKNYPNVGSPERVGLVGEADGSNLFLDEIGELPLEQQTHLLRVLDSDGEYQRLGESRARQSSFRLFAATNRPPETLKQDLCARFSVRLTVPSLNERRSDIPHLINKLLTDAIAETPETCERYFSSDGRARMSPSLIEALLRHTYGQHVRELERLLWLSMSTSRGSFMDLTDEVRAELKRSGDSKVPRATIDSGAQLREPYPTAAQIAEALATTGGSKTEAARILGLKSRYALYRLMKK